MSDGFGEHKRAVLGLILIVFITIFVVGGAKVYAGASFKRLKESGSKAGPEPINHSIQLVA